MTQSTEIENIEKRLLDAIVIWDRLRLGLPDTVEAYAKHCSEVLAPIAQHYQKIKAGGVPPAPPQSEYDRGRADGAGEMLTEWVVSVAFGLEPSEIDTALRTKAGELGYVHPSLRNKG